MLIEKNSTETTFYVFSSECALDGKYIGRIVKHESWLDGKIIEKIFTTYNHVQLSEQVQEVFETFEAAKSYMKAVSDKSLER